MSLPSVHLASLTSSKDPTLIRLCRIAERHPPRHYALTSDARRADAVLFVEHGYVGLESIKKVLAIRRNVPGHLYLFLEGDWPYPLLPGLYCSLNRSLPWAWSWSFLLDEAQTVEAPKRYLFSFIGRVSTHPIRERIAKLDTPETPCLDVTDAPQRFNDWTYRTKFTQVLAESYFILCPRGIGVSSIRLFEAMRVGCVPVIISDDWIEPPVGNWRDFSIRVAERDIEGIPQICASYQPRARAMGELAREVFARYFSATSFLDSALDFLQRQPSLGAGASPILWQALRAASGREPYALLSRARRAIFPKRSMA